MKERTLQEKGNEEGKQREEGVRQVKKRENEQGPCGAMDSAFG